MTNDLLVIIPTRQRPHTVGPIMQAFSETCTADTALLFAVDGCPEADDYQRAWTAHLPTYPATFMAFGPRRRLVGTLNHYSASEADRYTALAYMGDDHRPRTPGWDTRYLQTLAEHGPGLVYGDDMVQGEDLPTQVAISSAIITALGYMVPPDLVHMYCDNYWRDLGYRAECITYLPDVKIQHLHPCTGLAPWDASYHESNAASQYTQDRNAYLSFVANGGLDTDAAKIRKLRENP